MLEVLKQAIDYIENVPDDRDNVGHIDRKSLVLSLRQAIAELESQEPVAWRAPNWGHSADEYVYHDFDDPVIGVDGKPSPNNEPLYTHPTQRTWVGLTDEEAQWLYDNCRTPSNLIDMVEAKLKEKNNA